MSETAASLAALNHRLLKAIADAPPSGISELAERAGLVHNNINRKLEVLLTAGLLEKTGDASWDVKLTEAGERGLAAMAVWLGEAPPAEGGISYIPLGRLEGWAGNPRQHIPQKSIVDMAQSVADRGIETPITVRPLGERFQVLFGQRRWKGSCYAAEQGWIDPDALVPCQVRDLSDDEAEVSAGVENLQREDMLWADLARYFRHMMDDRRLTGPQLERMFGRKNYSARKIQDYAKIARELPEDVFALAYNPAYLDEEERRPNPQHLTYVKARDLVGDKKEKPALELSPRLAMTLAEVVAKGLADAGVLHLPSTPGNLVVTRFGRAPSGGPLGQLANDRKLLTFGFEGREVVARTSLTDELHRWLTQTGFQQDIAAALFKLRSAVVGEMQAQVLADCGEWATAELNPPEAPAAPAPLLSPEPAVETPAPAPAPAHTPGFRDDDDDGEEDDAPEPTVHQAPPSPPPSDDFDLPPMLAIVVIELAHKIGACGVERGPGTWAVEIRESYFRDARVMQLVQKHKAMAVFPLNRDKTLAALSKRSLDWLAAKDAVHIDNGRPVASDADLAAAQALLGFKPEDGGLYSTYWLNGAAATAPAAAQEAAIKPETPQVLEEPPRRDTFMQQVMEVASEDRALVRLAAALREARVAISSATSRKLTAKEADQLLSLIDAALDAARLPAEAA